MTRAALALASAAAAIAIAVLVSLVGLEHDAQAQGITACSAGGSLSLCISADKQAYSEGEPVILALDITASATVGLSYVSGQQFDLVVTTLAGEEVWRWSHDMVFTFVIWGQVLQPGETLDYVEVWHQGDNSGLQVPPGFYLVHGEGTFCTHEICDPLTPPVAISIASDVTEVEIAIKPGGHPNSINLSSRGVIPVAILTTPAFDATTVDAGMVRFGPGAATKAHKKGHVQDVDDDGDLDVLLHFRTQDTNIGSTDTEACLTAETFDGQQIEGCDSVRVVP